MQDPGELALKILPVTGLQGLVVQNGPRRIHDHELGDSGDENLLVDQVPLQLCIEPYMVPVEFVFLYEVKPEAFFDIHIRVQVQDIDPVGFKKGTQAVVAGKLFQAGTAPGGPPVHIHGVTGQTVPQVRQGFNGTVFIKDIYPGSQLPGLVMGATACQGQQED
jgi:hypothetical protein